MQAISSTPLNRLRVLDLSTIQAGRWAAMLLAEQGAELIRITVGVDGLSEAAAAYADRGKRVFRFDPEADSSSILALARKADVVLIDHGSPAMSDIAASDMASSTIVIRFTGYCEADASPGDDRLHAQLGVFTDVSITNPVLGLPPVYTPLPMASAYGAVHGAIAAVTAVLYRQATGRGDMISVPLASSLMAAMGSIFFRPDRQPWRYDVPPLPKPVRKLLPLVQAIARHGTAPTHRKLRGIGRSLLPPLMRFYRCRDGRSLYIFAMDHQRLPLRLLEVLDLWKPLQTAGLQVLDPYAEGVCRDNLCDGAMLSPKWKKRLRQALEARFAEAPAAHWEALLTDAGVPCAVARSLNEWLEQPWLREAGLIVEVADPAIGMTRQTGSASIVVGEVQTSQPRARQLLSGLPEWSPRSLSLDVPADRTQARPLEGLRVLDLASMVAGPLCARTLSELGATVIKIDPVAPAHGPRMTAWYGMEMSAGKRSVLLDISTADGAALLQRLAGDADVVVHNSTGAAGERLAGLIREAGAIECAISAFGGHYKGPWQSRKGYDPVLQAAAGVASRFGTPEAPELHAIASCVDCLTGYLATFGTLCALAARKETHEAPHVSTSLSQAIQFMQGEWIAAGETLPESCLGPEALGPSVLRRLYRCQDGWLFLDAREDQSKRLRERIAGFTSGSGDDEASLSSQLAFWFRLGDVDERIDTLKALSIAAVPVRSLEYWHARGRLNDPAVPFLIQRDKSHPCGSAVTRVGPGYLRSRNWTLDSGRSFPKLGVDTAVVLSTAGLTKKEIDEVFAQRVAADALAKEYLPQ